MCLLLFLRSHFKHLGCCLPLAKDAHPPLKTYSNMLYTSNYCLRGVCWRLETADLGREGG